MEGSRLGDQDGSDGWLLAVGVQHEEGSSGHFSSHAHDSPKRGTEWVFDEPFVAHGHFTTFPGKGLDAHAGEKSHGEDAHEHQAELEIVGEVAFDEGDFALVELFGGGGSYRFHIGEDVLVNILGMQSICNRERECENEGESNWLKNIRNG